MCSVLITFTTGVYHCAITACSGIQSYSLSQCSHMCCTKPLSRGSIVCTTEKVSPYVLSEPLARGGMMAWLCV